MVLLPFFLKIKYILYFLWKIYINLSCIFLFCIQDIYLPVLKTSFPLFRIVIPYFQKGQAKETSETMEADRPTTMMLTVLAIDHTVLCYKVCSVCERTLPDNPSSLCKYCNFNGFESASLSYKRLFRLLVSAGFPLFSHIFTSL